MSYELEFLPSARREWNKLPKPVQAQFRKKLAERLEEPHVPKSRLSGAPNCYKIKLRSSGYRLVYRSYKQRLIVEVIAIGKRDKGDVYEKMMDRLN